MTTIKRLFSVLLCALLLMMALSACSAPQAETPAQTQPADGAHQTITGTQTDDNVSPTLAALREKGTILVGSSNDAPFAYIDVTTGVFSGIDADIMREIASRLGIGNVEMKIVEWDSLILELTAASIDIIADAMYITETRKQQIYFTDVWYSEADAVVIPAGSPYTSFDDLKDATVAAQTGSEFLATVEAWKDEGLIADVAMYGEPDELLLAVNTGHVDACLVDDIIAYYIIDNNQALQLQLLPGYEASDEGLIGAALVKDDPLFLQELNDVLNEMKEDGTLLAILTAHGMADNYVGIEEGRIANID